MTLIVSVAVPSVVLQISDRRLTTLRSKSGRTEVVEEGSNKTILYDNRFLISYTGLAELEGMPTAIWLAKKLVGNPPRVAFDTIRRELTRVFQLPRTPKIAHSVVFVGFVNPGAGIQHAFGLITNCDPPQRCTTIKREFDLFKVPLAANQHLVAPIPRWMTDRAYSASRRNMQAVTRRHLSVAPAIRLCIQAMLEVASQHDEVGSNLMLAVLPKSALAPGASGVFSNSSPMEGEATFLYLPVASEPLQYAPIVVLGDHMMTDITIDPNAQSFSAQVWS